MIGCLLLLEIEISISLITMISEQGETACSNKKYEIKKIIKQ
jgi:hypothetical protein